MKTASWWGMGVLLQGVWACMPAQEPDSPKAVALWVQDQLQAQPSPPRVNAQLPWQSDFVPEVFSAKAAQDPFQTWQPEVSASVELSAFVFQGFVQDREASVALIRVGKQLGAWRAGDWLTAEWQLEGLTEDAVVLSRRIKARLPQGAWVWQRQKHLLRLDGAAKVPS
jgi:hypothetical protein